MAFLQILLALAALIYLLYRWATLKYKTFQKRGVPFEPPQPLVGNVGGVLLNKESFMKLIHDFYLRHKSEKIVGFYNFRDPAFMLMTPELIKKVTVKDFDYFPNHYPVIKSKHDPLLMNMLTAMNDQRWKDMRTTLSPAFTAAKMRGMFTLMNESFDESLKYLHEQSNNGEGFELEMKECFTRLSNDIIASTAFGLKVNSYVDRQNHFYGMGQTLTSIRGKQLIRFMFANIAPKLMDLLGFRIFDADKTDYFIHLVMDAMKYREEHNIVRPDMIQLLMEAKKVSNQQWSDVDTVAQCFLFFFAAFENNANFICITCHELARNPEIQQRLYEEAKDISADLNGAPLDYDVLGKMKYMEMVVSEALRKWPLAIFTDRVCAKDYKLNDDDGNFVFDFKKGDRILIPIIGLHRNEEYFEKPELFDPERFSEENKNNIKPFAYFPFGAGPRNCIGNRYALMQAKAMLHHLVLNFKMEPSPKASENLMEESRGFQISPENGFWMRFVPRK